MKILKNAMTKNNILCAIAPLMHCYVFAVRFSSRYGIYNTSRISFQTGATAVFMPLLLDHEHRLSRKHRH